MRRNWHRKRSMTKLPYESWKILQAGLIAFYSMQEIEGSVLHAWNPSIAQAVLLNGTIVGASLGHPTETPLGNIIEFDGSDYISLPASEIDNVFDPTKGTLKIWARANTWSDPQYIINLFADSNNNINIYQDGGELFVRYFAGGIESKITLSSPALTKSIFSATLTWDTLANGGLGEVKGYFNKNLIATLTNLGVWVGPMVTTLIGAETTIANFWGGGITQVALSNIAQPPQSIIEDEDMVFCDDVGDGERVSAFSNGFDKGFH